MRPAALLIASLVLLLVVAAPADAATTVGSNLSKTPTPSPIACDSASCTIAQRTLASPASGGLVAVAGVIVRWRVRNVSSPQAAGVTIALRTLRGQTAVGRGPGQVVPQQTGVLEFPARIAVAAGDRLGLDMSVPAGGEAARLAAIGSTATSWDVWSPALGDGESRSSTTRPYELLLNADIEADGDGDGFGDETQDHCPGSAGPQDGCPPGASPGGGPSGPSAPGTSGSTGQEPRLSALDTTKPRISSVTFSMARLRFRMSERASVKITVQHLRRGRLVRGHCRAETSRNRGAPRCERQLTVVSGKAVAEPGKNTLHLRKGQISAGAYRVRVTAVDRAGNRAKTFARRFSIRR